MTTREGKVLNGAHWRRTHALTARSLGVGVPVESRGNAFYCTARFTLNKFAVALCQFARYNGTKMPTRTDVENWVKGANNRYYTTGHGDKVSTDPKKRIVVAETPERVSTRLAMALNGGVLHESAHLLYTCQRDLEVDEMYNIVVRLWCVVKDWSKYQRLLLQWINLVEDIVIERRLRRDFANTHNDLADLQDLILKMEGKDDKVDEWRANATALSVVGGAFRDIGLGYNTVLARKAIGLYKEFDKAWTMVTDGPLTPLLKESIAVTDDDDIASFRIAMEVVGIIADLAGDGAETAEPPKGDDDDSGHKYDPCPACGASPKNLVIRGVYDDYGRKDTTKAMLVCRKCGHTQIIDIETQEGGGGGSVEGETPEFEDMDMNPPEDAEGTGGGEGDTEGDENADDPNGEGGGNGDTDTEDSDGENDGEAGDSGDAGDTEGEDTEGGNGGGNKPPVFKVGDKAMLQGVMVVVVDAGKVRPDGTQDVRVEPC